MTRQLVISTLPETNQQVSSFYKAESLKFSQILLGKTAQISAFIRISEHQGDEILFCHRPEIICTQLSKDHFTKFETPNKIIDWKNITHLRFDAPRNVRILKGANNFAVNSHAQTREMLSLSASARIMNFYPAAIKGVFTYEGIDPYVSVLPEGRPLDVNILNDNYITEDVPGRISAEKSGEIDLSTLLRTDVIQAFSFEEFSNPQSPCGQAFNPFHRHRDFEAAHAKNVIRAKLGQPRTAEGTFTLVPLNMDDDGRTLEYLISAIFSGMLKKEQNSTVCLAPFNINLLNHSRMKQVVERCAKLTGAHGLLRQFFFLFVRDSSALRLLDRLFDIAIIDGSDPDATWNLKRLKYLGIRSIVVTNMSNTEAWQKSLLPEKVFKLNHQSASELEDWYGKRAVISDEASLKEAADLMSLAYDLSIPAAEPLEAKKQLGTGKCSGPVSIEA